LVCGRFVCRRFSLSPFWSGQSVAVLVTPFWRVAVSVCRRFDHTPQTDTGRHQRPRKA